MAVPPSLLPSHSEKVLGAMKPERTVKRITFNPSEANPGETLYVSVPELAKNEVIVAGSLALVFNINLKVTGAHANNYLVLTCPGPWSTSSLSSLPPPRCRTRTRTASTRPSRTSSSQGMSVKTCCARASRATI